MNQSLRDIFVEGWYADKVIHRQLKANRKWGSQDRKLFAEALYDIVRWWRRLLFACDIAWPAEDQWRDDDAIAYSLAIEAWCSLHEVELGKNIPRVLPKGLDVAARFNDKSLARAVRESIPDWMDRWGVEELAERWEQLLPILNSVAPVYLRANRLKGTAQQLQKRLAQEKVESEVMGGDALKLKQRVNVFITKAFREGLFEVQDLHSQRVASEFGVEAGQRVIDACAGAGGKSLHLASLMQNKGKVIALDVLEKKLEALRERSTRAGATIIETRWIENNKVIKRLAESSDRVLLDVPCSGMGVLRRNPDAKWKLTPEEITHLNNLQTEILNGYSRMCRPGATLMYATCSMMPSENLKQVEKFLSRNEAGFSLEKEETLWPEAGGPDGFYFARLKRS
jgi:16S rRNA (cytosine967-C5)-methyltransferase